MLETGRLEIINNEREKYNIQILGLSETRWNGFGKFNIRKGSSLLYSGKQNEDDLQREGVALLLSKNARKGLMAWTPISERIITARFKSKVRNISIIQCYAPTEQASEENKDTFYEQLESAFQSLNKRDIFILMGDFNAQVGNNNTNREKIMGTHALGFETGNGGRFIDTCTNNNLVIGGTLFPHRSCHKETWVSPDGRTKNQIDHIAMSRAWRKSLLDVRAKRGADVGSDHHLLLAEIKIASIQRANVVKKKKYDLDKLKDEYVKNAFNLELSNRFEALQQHGNEKDLEELNEEIQTIFTESGEKVLGYKQRERKQWISNETWQMIVTRKELKNKVNSARTRAERNNRNREYSQMNREVKRGLRADKRKWINEMAERAQIAANRGNSRELYKITKCLSKKKFNSVKPIKDENGKLITNEDERVNKWKNYFETILNRDIHGIEAEGVFEMREQLRICIEPPTRMELINALKDIKNCKAPGLDGVPGEMLKCCPERSCELLLPLFQRIWVEEKIPKNWKKGIIVKIPKKGDLAKCENYRGITLLPVISKLFTRIVLHRIKGKVDDGLRKEQAGFRSSRSCTDQINTLRIIVEQSLEYNSALYLAFIDFEKAFDSVNRVVMWKIVESYGLPEKIINICKELYDGFQCVVEDMGKLSTAFEVSTGVRQGCMLSPLLFTLVIDYVMGRVVDRGRRGIQWDLEDLDFADDICLLSHRFQDMREKIQDLIEEAGRVGLKINSGKTKDLRINNQAVQPFIINGKGVEQFCYLGSIISSRGRTDEDIENRLRKAKGAFAQLRAIWKSGQLSQKVKLRLF